MRVQIFCHLLYDRFILSVKYNIISDFALNKIQVIRYIMYNTNKDKDKNKNSKVS